MEGNELKVLTDQMALLKGARERFEEREKRGDEILLPLMAYYETIEDSLVKSFCKSILCMAPDYFWTAPHTWEQKEGGLVTHTKKLAWLMNDILDFSGIPMIERDHVIAAVLLHDVFYYGLGQTWQPNMQEDPVHPFYLGNILDDRINVESNGHPNSLSMLPEDQRDTILRLIRAHKGPESISIELEPQTPVELLLSYANHLCKLPQIKIKLST